MDDMQQQGGATEATPEEQAQYDALVTKALELMYGDQSHDMVVERMKASSSNLPAMIGLLAANLARAGVAELRQQGQQVDDEIVAYAGFEIIAELMDLAQAIKLIPEGDDLEKIGHGAMYIAIRKYAELADKAGEVTDQDREDIRQGLQEQGLSGQEPPPEGQMAEQPAPQGGLLQQGAANG